MVLSGGIGNLIDRIIFGTVTDMLSFSIFPPVFNVADIFVTVGAALFVFAVLKGDIKYGKTL
jgi:signal peptidase II